MRKTTRARTAAQKPPTALTTAKTLPFLFEIRSNLVDQFNTCVDNTEAKINEHLEFLFDTWRDIASGETKKDACTAFKTPGRKRRDALKNLRASPSTTRKVLFRKEIQQDDNKRLGPRLSGTKRKLGSPVVEIISNPNARASLSRSSRNSSMGLEFEQIPAKRARRHVDDTANTANSSVDAGSENGMQMSGGDSRTQRAVNAANTRMETSEVDNSSVKDATEKTRRKQPVRENNCAVEHSNGSLRTRKQLKDKQAEVVMQDVEDRESGPVQPEPSVVTSRLGEDMDEDVDIEIVDDVDPDVSTQTAIADRSALADLGGREASHTNTTTSSVENKAGPYVKARKPDNEFSRAVVPAKSVSFEQAEPTRLSAQPTRNSSIPLAERNVRIPTLTKRLAATLDESDEESDDIVSRFSMMSQIGVKENGRLSDELKDCNARASVVTNGSSGGETPLAREKQTDFIEETPRPSVEQDDYMEETPRPPVQSRLADEGQTPRAPSKESPLASPDAETPRPTTQKSPSPPQTVKRVSFAPSTFGPRESTESTSSERSREESTLSSAPSGPQPVAERQSFEKQWGKTIYSNPQFMKMRAVLEEEKKKRLAAPSTFGAEKQIEVERESTGRESEVSVQSEVSEDKRESLERDVSVLEEGNSTFYDALEGRASQEDAQLSQTSTSSKPTVPKRVSFLRTNSGTTETTYTDALSQQTVTDRAEDPDQSIPTEMPADDCCEADIDERAEEYVEQEPSLIEDSFFADTEDSYMDTSVEVDDGSDGEYVSEPDRSSGEGVDEESRYIEEEDEAIKAPMDKPKSLFTRGILGAFKSSIGAMGTFSPAKFIPQGSTANVSKPKPEIKSLQAAAVAAKREQERRQAKPTVDDKLQRNKEAQQRIQEEEAKKREELVRKKEEADRRAEENRLAKLREQELKKEKDAMRMAAAAKKREENKGVGSKSTIPTASASSQRDAGKPSGNVKMGDEPKHNTTKFATTKSGLPTMNGSRNGPVKDPVLGGLFDEESKEPEGDRDWEEDEGLSRWGMWKGNEKGPTTIVDEDGNLPEPPSDYSSSSESSSQYSSSDEDDDDQDNKGKTGSLTPKRKKRKEKEKEFAPQWVATPELMRLIQMHERTDPDDVFVGTRPPIEELFENLPRKGRPYRARKESAWTGEDVLTEAEVAEYKKRMGFRRDDEDFGGGDGGGGFAV